MYNANFPKENELPSSKQLLISTFAAIFTASILLVTTILPAEYGIDPTGIGKALGLTRMGEIKMQLTEEALQEESTTPKNQVAAVPSVKPDINPQKDTINPDGVTSKSIQITLATGEAAEVKVAMDKGQTVTYSWKVDKGHVNFDNHGDNPETKYHNYSKGKAVKSDDGEIKAAFDGKHGWFWRNRSKETVTVTLKVIGEISSFERVL